MKERAGRRHGPWMMSINISRPLLTCSFCSVFKSIDPSSMRMNKRMLMPVYSSLASVNRVPQTVLTDVVRCLRIITWSLQSLVFLSTKVIVPSIVAGIERRKSMMTFSTDHSIVLRGMMIRTVLFGVDTLWIVKHHSGEIAKSCPFVV